jgi:hypothetical protein
MSNLHENVTLCSHAQPKNIFPLKKFFKLCNFSDKKHIQIFFKYYNLDNQTVIYIQFLSIPSHHNHLYMVIKKINISGLVYAKQRSNKLWTHISKE